MYNYNEPTLKKNNVKTDLKEIKTNTDFASLKGKRKTNEDTHVILENLDNKYPNKQQVNIYGIFDGHGGDYVSNYLAKNLPDTLTNPKILYPIKKTFCTNLYKYFQNELKLKHHKDAFSTGSTALVAIHFICNDTHYLNVLNVGDSRGIICRNNIAFPLTKDHKPNIYDEYCRLTGAGGKVYFDGYDYRIGDLSVSKAFGDIENEHISCEPDIFKYTLTKDDKFMVLACDGLFDVMTNDEIINFILLHCYDTKNKNTRKCSSVAHKLAEYAIKTKKSTDNVSIIVVFFD
jgi:serine/threonine protein phosphatase PrpC